MRRISTSIAFALSTLLFVSICSAQQTATTSQHTATSVGNPANTTKLGGGPDTVINCVGAQVGRISVFTQTLPPNVILCNSGIYEAAPYGTGPIGILNPHPVAALDVTGDVNASMSYKIGGSVVLTDNVPNSNLSIGPGAGTVVSGTGNTFVGANAGTSNTGNTAHNTFIGSSAGQNDTVGYPNVFVGDSAGYSDIDGSYNLFSGYEAGYNNSNGVGNTFVGPLAGINNVSGSSNTFVGTEAGINNTTGFNNVFVGGGAGSLNVSGNNNIYVGDPAGSPDESTTIRIGTSYQTAAYIGGIYGTVVSGLPVYINSSGQLGLQTSSLRFKEQIHDMGDSTSALMKLRPVTFLYKPEYDKGDRSLQYGLIAEEVAKIYPDLVAYDNDGKPYTVRYQYLATMLLNEMQKQYHRAQAEAKVITAQEQKINELEQRLSRLERLVPQTIAQK